MTSVLLILCAGISPAFVHGIWSLALGGMLALFILIPMERIKFPRLLHRLMLFILFVDLLLACGHFAALLLPWHHAHEIGIGFSLLFTGLVIRKKVCLLFPLLPIVAAFCCLALQPIYVSPVPFSLPLHDVFLSLFLLHSMKKTLPGKTCPPAAYMLFLLYALQALALPVPLLQRMRAFGLPGHGISAFICFCACLLRCCAAGHCQSALGAAADPAAAFAADRHPSRHTGA